MYIQLPWMVLNSMTVATQSDAKRCHLLILIIIIVQSNHRCVARLIELPCHVDTNMLLTLSWTCRLESQFMVPQTGTNYLLSLRPFDHKATRPKAIRPPIS